MRFYFAPLFFNNAAQLPFHRFESVVDHFVKRLVRSVVDLPFIGDELVASGHRHIDTASVWISFVMRMIGLLDSHVAAVDVIAKFFKSRCIF